MCVTQMGCFPKWHCNLQTGRENFSNFFVSQNYEKIIYSQVALLFIAYCHQYCLKKNWYKKIKTSSRYFFVCLIKCECISPRSLSDEQINAPSSTVKDGIIKICWTISVSESQQFLCWFMSHANDNDFLV